MSSLPPNFDHQTQINFDHLGFFQEKDPFNLLMIMHRIALSTTYKNKNTNIVGAPGRYYSTELLYFCYDNIHIKVIISKHQFINLLKASTHLKETNLVKNNTISLV